VLGDVERMPLADASFDVAACRAAVHHFPRPEVVVREMIRVTRPRARFLIADQVSSEDTDKAALHNEIERLCDPTHVRALSESEFELLFARLRLTVAFKGRATIDYSVADRAVLAVRLLVHVPEGHLRARASVMPLECPREWAERAGHLPFRGEVGRRGALDERVLPGRPLEPVDEGRRRCERYPVH